jgi:hypothetical protein
MYDADPGDIAKYGEVIQMLYKLNADKYPYEIIENVK